MDPKLITETHVEIPRIILPPKMTPRQLAEILGVHPITVRRRLKKYGLRRCRDGLIKAVDARTLLCD